MPDSKPKPTLTPEFLAARERQAEMILRFRQTRALEQIANSLASIDYTLHRIDEHLEEYLLDEAGDLDDETEIDGITNLLN